MRSHKVARPRRETSPEYYRGVPIMRSRKVGRTRRAMSPDYYQIALQSLLANVRGVCAYHWSKTFGKCGYSAVRIVVRLHRGVDNAAAAEATVDSLMRELEVFVQDFAIMVTYSEAAFWSMVQLPTLAST
jgi:hypothetical protein